MACRCVDDLGLLSQGYNQPTIHLRQEFDMTLSGILFGTLVVGVVGAVGAVVMVMVVILTGGVMRAIEILDGDTHLPAPS